MNYMSLFDADGKRVTSVPCDDDLTDEKKAALEADGYVEIDEDEWNYYVGNRGTGTNGTGYIRGTDGKPTDAPAVVVTTEQKQASIAADYESQISELKDALATATLAGDDTLIAELKSEYAEVKAEYEKALKEAE